MVVVNDVQKQLKDLCSEMLVILKDNLVGIYLHGSLAMGCFNPETSDIDILAVVRNVIDKKETDQIKSFLLEFGESLLNKLEINFVTLSSIQNLEYPSPCELSFSSDVNKFSNETNPDLPANFVITQKRGAVLYGEPISDIFSDVPKKLYLKSIVHDFEWSFNNVLKGEDEGTCRVPNYAILNFCRTIAFIKDNLITSKKEGGEWGLNNLPEKYKQVIREALREYSKKDNSEEVDCKILKDFAKYTKEIIELV